ncbi:hypothetical protein [Moraxella cuniculi]|uniref:Uncharacterized protein n=1 Tax=Moraxella cuniculi TaxID=34061 RepID=A0A3S4UKC0_9GAMM|nr:hypothetical protein [Moraxella cuniculi]VEG12848.1 Uncharacterised protein [Moraxella cuniculi]
MFFAKFNEFLADLEQNPIVDEWYMSNFAEKNIKTLEPYEAFDNLRG